MVVIYAEKSSLAKEIAASLHAGNRIAHPKEPTIGHYEFTFKGEKAVLCHGVGHLCGLTVGMRLMPCLIKRELCRRFVRVKVIPVNTD